MRRDCAVDLTALRYPLARFVTALRPHLFSDRLDFFRRRGRKYLARRAAAPRESDGSRGGAHHHRTRRDHSGLRCRTLGSAPLRQAAFAQKLFGHRCHGVARQTDAVFSRVIYETGRYAHVRYIDNEGHEVIRTNYDGGRSVIVPHEQLQDKSGRPYVRETLKLAEGEIYVSPMDLNVENDQVETPHRPVIRFGTPAFDSGGHKKGMVLLNYAGEILQRRFRAALQGGDVHSARLLNRDGYWLSSPTPEDEWGFVLGRPDRNFGRVFPEAWGAISTSEHGTVLTRDGLFVYTTVYPLTDPARAAATVDAALSG